MKRKGKRKKERDRGTNGKIRQTRVHHQREEVDDQVRVLSQDVVSLAAVHLELLIVPGLKATHAFHHLFRQPHRCWPRLGVLTEYEAEVEVPQMTLRGRQQTTKGDSHSNTGHQCVHASTKSSQVSRCMQRIDKRSDKHAGTRIGM